MAKRGSKGGLRRFVAASAAAVAMVMFAPTAADAAAAVSKIGAAVEPHTFDAQAKEHDGYIWRPKKHSNRGFFFVEKGAHQKSQNVVENNMVLPSEGDKAVSEDAVRDTSEPESSAEEDTGDEEQAAQSNSLDKKHKMKAPRDEDENSDDSQTGAFVQNKGKFFFATRDGKEASQKDQGSFIQNHGKFFFATKDGKEASQQDQGSFIQNHGKFFFATKDGKEASQKHQGSFTSTKDGPSKKKKS